LNVRTDCLQYIFKIQVPFCDNHHAAVHDIRFIMDRHTFEHLQEELSGKPYEAKWEVLRPVIEYLFIEKRETIPQIAKALREQVGFYAT